jgi:hypothetical protein
MSRIGSPDERMFFLVGRGRSGTTLLQTILNAHPAVSVAPEALFVMNLVRKYRDQWRIENFGDEVFLEARMRRWKLDRDALDARWGALPDDAGFARACAEVYEEYADEAHKELYRLLGDKNPHYALFTETLGELFPSAKFVYVVRDYRDNILSYQNVPFDLSSPGALAYRWVHYNNAVLKAAVRWPERFHQLRFEDLVHEPVATIDALCAFLGIEPAEVMFTTHESDTLGVEWHRHLNRPIDPQLAGQWRDGLDPKTVEIADRICQPLGARFGYLPETPARRRAYAGVALGWAVTTLERSLFRFPVALQALVIRTYRRLTGNVIR